MIKVVKLAKKELIIEAPKADVITSTAMGIRLMLIDHCVIEINMQPAQVMMFMPQGRTVL